MSYRILLYYLVFYRLTQRVACSFPQAKQWLQQWLWGSAVCLQCHETAPILATMMRNWSPCVCGSLTHYRSRGWPCKRASGDLQRLTAHARTVSRSKWA